MKIKVIYIAGEGRSGSTLLERILGQHPLIFSAGELRHIWERSFLEDQLCSCGQTFSKCTIWTNIRKKFFKLQNNLNINEVIEAFNKTARIRHYLLNKSLENNHSHLINRIYFDLYQSIKEVTQKDFIVDASKHPMFAHILSCNKKIDLYVIHLTRDPRGVAYSWTKKKIRPEIVNRKVFMPRYSILRSSLSWNIINKIALDLKYKNVKYLHVKYENLVDNPTNTLNEIYSFLNIFKNENIINGNNVKLELNHTVAGNPMRFNVGNIQLKPDIEWKHKMPIYQQIIIKYLNINLIKSLKYI